MDGTSIASINNGFTNAFMKSDLKKKPIKQPTS